MAVSNSGKDTIYIDLDDEITTVIEKVRSSNEKIVALVLPKRASVLQSIVNMKLLKRSADAAKKHIVLITSEVGLLPLAGTVGFHVAKNLQSKPEIPGVAALPDDSNDDLIDDQPINGPDADDGMAASGGNQAVGDLAAAAASHSATTGIKPDAIETLDMDDDGSSPNSSAESNQSALAKSPQSKKKDKKLAIPNFNRFRLLLILGGLLLIVLIGGLYVCLKVLPKGSVTLTTDTSDVDSNLSLNLDTSVKALDAKKLTVPAQIQQTQKSGSQQVPTTGQKNNGTPSKGSVTLTNCSADGTERDVPAGTGISTGGHTYITQDTVRLVTSTFDSHGNCKSTAVNSTSVDVVAQTNGNLTVASGTAMTVAGISDATAKVNDDIGGGTDNIIQIVAQADLDSATQKITAPNTDSIKSSLEQQLKQAGEYPIESTFTAGTPTTTYSSQLGDQATTVTATQTTNYSMFGVKESDLKTLVDDDVKGKIDASKQSILSEGLDKATYKLNGSNATTAQVALSTTATAGPDLKADSIAQQITGKKAGDIQTLLKADPGVTNVQVHFSPFWVTKAPKPSKLTVTFDKASS